MAEYKIPEQFFKDNPIPDVCRGMFLLFEMDVLFDEHISKKIDEAKRRVMPEKRTEEMQRDAELTEAAKTSEEIIDRMRKGEIANRKLVCSKALAMEDEIMPEVIRRLKRSSYDNFIETAVLALSRAKECYIDQIIQEYNEIRAPYALVAVCILLAFRNRFDTLPLIMKTFENLKKRKDEEERKCAEGALYAIYSLTRHFPSKTEKSSGRAWRS